MVGEVGEMKNHISWGWGGERKRKEEEESHPFSIILCEMEF